MVTKKKRRVFWAGLMLLIMLVNIFGGGGYSFGVNAESPGGSYYRNESEKTIDGVTIEQKVTDYYSYSGEYVVELSIKADDRNKVSNATITAPMSQQVEYAYGNDIKMGSASIAFSDNTLKVTNIQLDNTAKAFYLRYIVRLKDNWKDGEFYKIHESAVLTGSTVGDLMFDVPSIRANTHTNTYSNTQKTTLTVELEWIGPVGDSASFPILEDGVPNGQTLDIKRNSSDFFTSGSKWGGRKELPKYRNGRQINYSVGKADIPGYEGEIVNNNGNPNLFKFKYTNVETIDYKVQLKWIIAPEKMPFTRGTLRVGLLKNGNFDRFDRDSIQEQEVYYGDNNLEITFSNLPKYDRYGGQIRYSARLLDTFYEIIDYEKNPNKGILENYPHKFHVSNQDDRYENLTRIELYHYIPTYGVAPCSIKLQKEWEGGEPVDVKFTLTYRRQGQDFKKEITLPKDKTEIDITSLPMYEEDSFVDDPLNQPTETPVYYTIKEEDVEGYVAETKSQTFDFPSLYRDYVNYYIQNNQSICNAPHPQFVIKFKNTKTNASDENTYTITKKWVGTPKEGLKVGLFSEASFNTDVPTTSAVMPIEGKNNEEKIIFKNVKLKDGSGAEIKYVAREIDTDGKILKGEAGESFTLDGKKYNVSYDDANFLITNTEDAESTPPGGTTPPGGSTPPSEPSTPIVPPATETPEKPATDTPTKPSEPTEPGKPTEPTEPTKPSSPTEPTTPDTPSTPETPVLPVVPMTTPETPTEPSSPTESTVPGTPATPSIPSVNPPIDVPFTPERIINEELIPEGNPVFDIVNEGDTPLGKAEINKEEKTYTFIDDDKAPKGVAKIHDDNTLEVLKVFDDKVPQGRLPRTGGSNGNRLILIGVALFGLGLIIRKKIR